MKYENDEELIHMVCESNEDVSDNLYQLYEPLIKYLTKKYVGRANALGIESNDLYQEALVGFADAIHSYDESKAASLKTFVTLCIERRLNKVIQSANRPKNKFSQESLSLDYVYEEYGESLLNFIPDDTLEPLQQLSDEEKLKLLEQKIRYLLSEHEYEVYLLLKKGLTYLEIAKKLDKTPKQIDNTMQRVRNKIKMLLRGNEDEIVH